METCIPILLLTPPLEETESLLAYMYRAAEANAYPRFYVGNPLALAHSFLSLLGDRNLDLSLELRRRLTPAPILAVKRSMKPSFSRLGGDQLPISAIRTGARNVCPRCLAEKPWCRGEWELKSYVACGRHGVRLVDQCDKCKRKLYWWRTELTRCFCGRSLADIETRGAVMWETLWSVQVEISFRESINNFHRLKSQRLTDTPMRLFHLLEMANAIRAGYYLACSQGDGLPPDLSKCTDHVELNNLRALT